MFGSAAMVRALAVARCAAVVRVAVRLGCAVVMCVGLVVMGWAAAVACAWDGCSDGLEGGGWVVDDEVGGGGEGGGGSR